MPVPDSLVGSEVGLLHVRFWVDGERVLGRIVGWELDDVKLWNNRTHEFSTELRKNIRSMSWLNGSDKPVFSSEIKIGEVSTRKGRRLAAKLDPWMVLFARSAFFLIGDSSQARHVIYNYGVEIPFGKKERWEQIRKDPFFRRPPADSTKAEKTNYPF